MPGLLHHSAATVIKYLLIDAGLGSASLSNTPWPIFIGSEPTKPDECVTIYSRNLHHKGKDQRGEVAELMGIDLRLRSSEYALGDYRILAIKDFLDGVHNMVVSVPEFTSVGLVIPTAVYRVVNFSRNFSSRGTAQYLHLGKERQQNATTDIVSVSQREIFAFGGRVCLRMVT